jgi:hypothetical protein
VWLKQFRKKVGVAMKLLLLLVVALVVVVDVAFSKPPTNVNYRLNFKLKKDFF